MRPGASVELGFGNAPEVAEPQPADLGGGQCGQDVRTGIRRYRKSPPSAARNVAGLSGSTVSSTTSSVSTRVDAVAQERGIERDREFAAFELGVERLLRVPDILRSHRHLDAGRTHRKAHCGVVAVLTDDLHAVERIDERVARHGDTVRVSAGDELLVVREVALDQARRDFGARRAEHDVALPQHHLDLAVAGKSLHFGETLGRDENALAFLEHAHALEVADCEPVRVGGDEAEAAAVRSEQHTREDRPQVVFRRGSYDLTQCRRERGRVDRDPLPVGGREARVVLGRLQAQRRREPARGHDRLVAGDRHQHRARLEPANNLADQLGNHRHALLFDFGGDRHAVGDLEVGSDELESGLARGDPQILQDRQRATSARDGPLGRRHRLGEGVTLAPELHQGLLNTAGSNFSSCSSRACGLGTTGLSGCSGQQFGWGPPSPCFHRARTPTVFVPSRIPRAAAQISPAIHRFIHWHRA